MAVRRLAHGGRIDRQNKVKVLWDGKPLEGFRGDSLAAVLLAGNQMVVGRSFKYHRPRGVTSAGVEESGALVTLGEGAHTDPNVKATLQEAYDGLKASGQNAFPNVRYDIASINNVLSRFFSAGFYYKTFMGIPPLEWGKGTKVWMFYEKFIRRAAGLGHASKEADPDQYEHAWAHCDVMVIGSGLAGMHAAKTAAKAGLEVILVEQDSLLGGNLLSEPYAKSERIRQNIIAELRQLGVRIMRRTAAFGLYDSGVIGLLEHVTDHGQAVKEHAPRQRLWVVRSQQIILATGAIERMFAFSNNDLPGIMTASSARTYLNRYSLLLGERIVIATNNDSVYDAALEFAIEGAQVTVLDCRDNIDASLEQRCRASKVDIRFNASVLKALGKKQVNGVITAVKNSAGAWQQDERLSCDLLLLSGGWSPSIHLLSHRGVKPTWQSEHACFTIASDQEPVHMAGAADALWSAEQCQWSGIVAAQKACTALGCSQQDMTPMGPGTPTETTPIAPLFEVAVTGKAKKAFVDLQHDVTTSDVELALQEGFVSVEHLKRYTTLGMATDGGKVGNVIGIGLMAKALNIPLEQVGTTTFRPPYRPIALGALTGRFAADRFKPIRRTPLHDWNLHHQAVMTSAGMWQRPWYYSADVSHEEGQFDMQALNRSALTEAQTVRTTVALCDVSTLGKIAVQGPDAGEFLDRVYVNSFSSMPVGKVRYGIMLRDDGMVFDDGTTWRLNAADFFMTTTTAHAAPVLEFLESLLQTRWSSLKVHLTSVTDQWASVAVAGPKSRELLERCVFDPAVVSNQKLPFMGWVNAQLKGGIDCRIARISFSGEMAYEVYAPADYGAAVMDVLHDACVALDGCLYGLEALGTLRIEKGHMTNAELDGRVTLADIGLANMAKKKKAYVGQTLSQRPALLAPKRPKLVGIFPKDRQQQFASGAILCQSDQVSGLGEGWVTAATPSVALGHHIGLGFIAGGVEAWKDKTLIAADPIRNSFVEVEVVSPYMYDPNGDRMRG